jgi:hypothetical protein
MTLVQAYGWETALFPFNNGVQRKIQGYEGGGGRKGMEGSGRSGLSKLDNHYASKVI